MPIEPHCWAVNMLLAALGTTKSHLTPTILTQYGAQMHIWSIFLQRTSVACLSLGVHVILEALHMPSGHAIDEHTLRGLAENVRCSGRRRDSCAACIMIDAGPLQGCKLLHHVPQNSPRPSSRLEPEATTWNCAIDFITFNYIMMYYSVTFTKLHSEGIIYQNNSGFLQRLVNAKETAPGDSVAEGKLKLPRVINCRLVPASDLLTICCSSSTLCAAPRAGALTS